MRMTTATRRGIAKTDTGQCQTGRRDRKRLASIRLLGTAARLVITISRKRVASLAAMDGWGVAGGRLQGETARAYAARAAQSDFEVLRRWCDGAWSYVGVAVTVSKSGIELTGRYDHAIWGVESFCGDYVATLACENASEALEAARSAIASLAA